MAFAEISRFANSQSVSATGTRNYTFTLGSAPAAGQWVAIALYTNRGPIPGAGTAFTNQVVNSLTVGSVTLPIIDQPPTGLTQTPTLYASPYQSGMTSTVTVNWTNTGYASIVLGVVALVFTGADTSVTSGYNAFKAASPGTGRFDGGGTGTFGNGSATSSGGVTTWTNSAAIPTSYDSQGQPFLAAIVDYNIPTSATLQVARATSLFGILADSSGNVYAAFGTPGTLPINNTTGVYDPGGLPAYAVAYGDYGNFVFTYTGISGGSLTGCQLASYSLEHTLRAYGGQYCPLMLAGAAATTITSIVGSASSLAPEIGGFSTGKTGGYFNASAGSTQQGHVMIGMGGTGTTPARLHLMGGTQTSGATFQPAYTAHRIGGTNSTNGGGVIYTLVPSTRILVRSNTTTLTDTVVGTDATERPRSAAASEVETGTGSDSTDRPKQAAASEVENATGSQSATRPKQAAAQWVETATGSKSASADRAAAAGEVGAATGSDYASRYRSAAAQGVETSSSSSSSGKSRQSSVSGAGSGENTRSTGSSRSSSVFTTVSSASSRSSNLSRFFQTSLSGSSASRRSTDSTRGAAGSLAPREQSGISRVRNVVVSGMVALGGFIPKLGSVLGMGFLGSEVPGFGPLSIVRNWADPEATVSKGRSATPQGAVLVERADGARTKDSMKSSPATEQASSESSRSLTRSTASSVTALAGQASRRSIAALRTAAASTRPTSAVASSIGRLAASVGAALRGSSTVTRGRGSLKASEVQAPTSSSSRREVDRYASSAVHGVADGSSRRGVSALKSTSTALRLIAESVAYVFKLGVGFVASFTERPKTESFTEFPKSVSAVDEAPERFSSPSATVGFHDDGVASYMEGQQK